MSCQPDPDQIAKAAFGPTSLTILGVLAVSPEPSVKMAHAKRYAMHTLVALPPKTVLPMLQQHGAHLPAWLLSLSRTPEPSRVPQPVRPDAPSRPHMPPRQPYPTRQE
jgi:hypothetical protein